MKEESFEVFGTSFQTRVLQAILKDYKFFQNIYGIIHADYFSTDGHACLLKVIKDYFEEYKTIPTTESLKVELASLSDSKFESDPVLLREEMKKILWEVDHKINVKEIEQAQKKAFRFCSNKRMEGAILSSVDLLKQGKYDEIQKTIQDALKDSSELDIGHEYMEDLRIRTSVSMRKTVPTGFPELDGSHMDGGLAQGELGVIMAPTGGGKSFWLTNIGYGALCAGIDVVHYTFELSEANVGWRYDARITGVPIKEVVKNVDEVEAKLKEFKGGKLVIKEFPTKSATVNQIRFHFEHLRTCGYNPGVIILDYADLMKSRRGYDQKRLELEMIYEDLRGLSMDLKIPIWTAAQTNRSGFNEEIITLDKMGESIAKAQISDFIVSFSRTLAEKKRGLGKLFIAKNRIGEDGFWLPVTTDIARAKILVSKRLDDDDYSGGSSDRSDDSGGLLGEVFDRMKDKKGLEI